MEDLFETFVELYSRTSNKKILEGFNKLNDWDDIGISIERFNKRIEYIHEFELKQFRRKMKNIQIGLPSNRAKYTISGFVTCNSNMSIQKECN
ncbi:MAG TPA: hypothetical protein VGB84_01095 [Arachidicoccus sp.]